uniref:Uncharacterized protein n=1 Tax=Timspurckia oligopyrenoides TaxID=708627 RepID=A0A7S1EPW1_9RHOD
MRFTTLSSISPISFLTFEALSTHTIIFFRHPSLSIPSFCPASFFTDALTLFHSYTKHSLTLLTHSSFCALILSLSSTPILTLYLQLHSTSPHHYQYPTRYDFIYLPTPQFLPPLNHCIHS